MRGYCVTRARVCVQRASERASARIIINYYYLNRLFDGVSFRHCFVKTRYGICQSDVTALLLDYYCCFFFFLCLPRTPPPPPQQNVSPSSRTRFPPPPPPRYPDNARSNVNNVEHNARSRSARICHDQSNKFALTARTSRSRAI